MQVIRAVRDRAVRGLLQLYYDALKALTRPNPDKVLFLSRHADRETLDFRLLRAELQQREPNVQIVSIACRFEGGLKGILPFSLALLRSMYHLASARICVLDSYWPAVSMLSHRPSLTIYQMWHSLGKIKRTGKQAVGKQQGRSESVSASLKMHEGYDFVVAGAEIWNRHYRETFGVAEEQVLHIGLPRADYLVNQRNEIREQIRARYPALAQKPLVLYVPTFRRTGNEAQGAKQLLEVIDTERFALVVKKHKDDRLALPPEGVLTCPEFSGFEMLAAADYVITDYSSIALEAALINVPTLYYVYDYDDYLQGNGVNIDLFAEMPGCVFSEAEQVAAALDRRYPSEALAAYKQKFLFEDPGHSTSDLVSHLIEEGSLCCR